MKILIFGGSGFLGTKLKNIFSDEGHEVLNIDHKKNSEYILDATKFKQVSDFLKSQKPDIIIDTIALSNSVECEQNPKLAKSLNFTTAKNLSLAAKEINAKLFFISSSYVFDGKRGNYSEEDLPSPEGVYAKTKFMAEKELLKEKKNIIFRVDLLYGYNGKNAPNGIFGKILCNKTFYVGNPNQIRSPLFIEDIPPIIEKLYFLNQEGLFNLSGPDKIKMIDFLLKLENLIRKDSKICLIKNEKLLVPEKENYSLNSDKIHKLRVKMHNLEESLKRIKKEL